MKTSHLIFLKIWHYKVGALFWGHTYGPDLLIKLNNFAIPHYRKHLKQVTKPTIVSSVRKAVIKTIIRKHLTYRHIHWQLVKLSLVTVMDNNNLTFLWGLNFLIFKVFSNFHCLFSGFLRFSGPLTPFSGFSRFLRLSGSASHPVYMTPSIFLNHFQTA